MNYRMTIYPAMEETNKTKVFLFETVEQMVVGRDVAADLLLFLQDEIKVMPDYSNCFLLEELDSDGDWGEYEEFD